MFGRIWAFFFGSQNHVLVTANCTIAIVTTIYAVFSFAQWRAMNEANTINAKNSYELQRPFMYANHVDMNIVSSTSEITGYDINPVFQNGGNSAPKTLAVFINYYTPDQPMPIDYDFPDLVSVEKISGIAGPKDVVHVNARTFTPADMKDFADKKRFLYIYGHVEYDDTFAGSPHHLTMFCFQLTGIRGNPAPTLPIVGNGQQAFMPTIAFNFPACPKHNCTDEACSGANP